MSRPKKPKRKAVQRIPSTAPAARDEGPRLIPLHEKREDGLVKTSEYYARLADKILHPLT
jgi:hypothetical protein